LITIMNIRTRDKWVNEGDDNEQLTIK